MTFRRRRGWPALVAGLLPVWRPKREPETAVLSHQAQGMEPVGQLAGGVVHDLNNHLQVVSANLELMQPRLAGDAWLSERLAAAMAGIERATRLSRHLLAYARPQLPAPEAVDAGALLSATAEMLRPMLGEAIHVETVLAHGLPPVTVDPQQLETALLNLALNARDAMPDGGRLTFVADRLTVAANDAASPDGLAPGDRLQITVRDTGTGMTPEQLRRATEAFYTTKPPGKGTGLGLAMVHAFASQSGGTLELRSEFGRGTTALLSLPCRDMAPRQARAADVARGPLLVLLAEDEPTIRMATAELISEMGHQVREAADGADAIDVLREQPVDLLIADLGLPDMDDLALIERASALQPPLRVIVTTGRDDPGSDAWPRLRWLGKPYDGAALREAIEGAAALPSGFATA